MAETTPQQQQYPDLNPYSGSNGNGSVEESKNTILRSKVGAIHYSLQRSRQPVASIGCCLREKQEEQQQSREVTSWPE